MRPSYFGGEIGYSCFGTLWSKGVEGMLVVKEGLVMSIIRTHDFTLYGGNEEYQIVLRSLADKYLPYLYKWNADSEVLYWTEGEEGLSYPKELVEKIYGGISQDNICFIIEVNVSWFKITA